MKKKLDDLKTFILYVLLGPITILIPVVYFIIFRKMVNFSTAFFLFMIILIVLLIIRYYFGYSFYKKKKKQITTL